MFKVLTPLDIDDKYLEPDKDYAWKDGMTIGWRPCPAYMGRDCHKIMGNIVTYRGKVLCWRLKQEYHSTPSTQEQLDEVKAGLLSELKSLGGSGIVGITSYIGTKDPRKDGLYD